MGAPPLDALATALGGHVRAIHDAAASSPPGGGPAWDALLRHYGLQPHDPRERAMSAQYLRMTRGATPGEVRVAFGGLAQWAQGELDRLGADPSLAPLPQLASLRAAVASLVDVECAAYERSVGLVPAPAPSPALPSLGSIFANAEKTSKEVPWANMKFDPVSSLTCVHCGGPQEKPMDFMCKYCRRPIAGSLAPNT